MCHVLITIVIVIIVDTNTTTITTAPSIVLFSTCFIPLFPYFSFPSSFSTASAATTFANDFCAFVRGWISEANAGYAKPLVEPEPYQGSTYRQQANARDSHGDDRGGGSAGAVDANGGEDGDGGAGLPLLGRPGPLGPPPPVHSLPGPVCPLSPSPLAHYVR